MTYNPYHPAGGAGAVKTALDRLRETAADETYKEAYRLGILHAVDALDMATEGAALSPAPPIPNPEAEGEAPVLWQWRSRLKGGAWDAWERGRFNQEVPPFAEVEERALYTRPSPAPEIAGLRAERDALRGVLSGLSSFLGAGLGDDATTAEQFDRRIREGIETTYAPMVEAWQRSISEGK